MADKSLFGRLRRLFSTNVIVRNVGGRKLKVADTEQIQSATRSHLVDRYSKLHSGLDLVSSGYSSFAQLQAARLGLFKDYESMEADSIIAAALDIYADECTMKNPYGEVLQIQTDNDNIKQILQRKMDQGEKAAEQLYKMCTKRGNAESEFAHFYALQRNKDFDYVLGYYTFTSMTPDIILKFLRENKFF